jgi:hypothetical protein
MFPFAELTDAEFLSLFPRNYDVTQGQVYYKGVWYPCDEEWGDEEWER